MSMLAEPRRKQRVFNLRAKNNVWSNDTEKFGQKMLEKMGWSSGKGLGANENGIVEHVSARYKNDSGGLGFSDKNDQWTKNEQDFEGLLKSLSGVDDPTDDDSHKIASLEEKSKRSQSRVHYHKFTRGKDLSKYSEKDLANILGKKTLKDKPKLVEKVDTKEEKNTVTGQLFTTKGTTADYFKNIKTRFTKNTILNGSDDTDNVSQSNAGFMGFSQSQSNDTLQNGDSEIDQNLSENIKLSKKKKKNMTVYNIEKEDSPTIELINSNSCEEGVMDIIVKKKKQKRKKSVEADVQKDDNLIAIKCSESTLSMVNDLRDSHIASFKKKKNRSKTRTDSIEINQNLGENINLSKKSMTVNNIQNKDSPAIEPMNSNSCEKDVMDSIIKKKKKNRSIVLNVQQEDHLKAIKCSDSKLNLVNELCDNSAASIKKKKKRSKTITDRNTNINEDNSHSGTDSYKTIAETCLKAISKKKKKISAIVSGPEERECNVGPLKKKKKNSVNKDNQLLNETLDDESNTALCNDNLLPKSRKRKGDTEISVKYNMHEGPIITDSVSAVTKQKKSKKHKKNKLESVI